MSGFIGAVFSPDFKNEDHLLADSHQSILKTCHDYSGKWASQSVDIRFGWLKVTNDTFDERMPFSFDQNLYITGDVRLDGRSELIAHLKLHFADLNSTFPDAYILLRAYQLWGEDCLEKISGDYAFAIWDEKSRSLFCARDHFGVIPFYYAETDRGFIFTNFYSALKDIPRLLDLGDLNEEVLRSYFLLGHDGSFSDTIYNSIKKLPPAHQLTLIDGKLKISAYWQPRKRVKPIRYKTTNEYIVHFTTLFEAAVADRLRSNKIASQLSGGMDSSSIIAMAKKTLSETYPDDHELVAYTTVYKRLVKENEGFFALLIGKKLKIPVKQVVADDYLGKMSLKLHAWIPEPAGIPHAAAEHYIVSDASINMDVLLTGFGGDPFFSFDSVSWWDMFKQGHFFQPIADLFRFVKTHHQLPGIGFKLFIKKLLNKPINGSEIPDWIDPDFISQEYVHEKLIVRGNLGTNRKVYESTLWQSFFEHAHPGFSGIGLKVRFPFFSLRMSEFLEAMPPHLLHRKYLLRLAMIPYLPKEIIHRQKTHLYGNAQFHNLKSSGVLKELIDQIPQEQAFFENRIDIPLFLEEIGDIRNLKELDYRKMVFLINVLAWKNHTQTINF